MKTDLIDSAAQVFFSSGTPSTGGEESRSKKITVLQVMLCSGISF